jgi:hypothetical protein
MYKSPLTMLVSIHTKETTDIQFTHTHQSGFPCFLQYLNRDPQILVLVSAGSGD